MDTSFSSVPKQTTITFAEGTKAGRDYKGRGSVRGGQTGSSTEKSSSSGFTASPLTSPGDIATASSSAQDRYMSSGGQLTDPATDFTPNLQSGSSGVTTEPSEPKGFLNAIKTMWRSVEMKKSQNSDPDTRMLSTFQRDMGKSFTKKSSKAAEIAGKFARNKDLSSIQSIQYKNYANMSREKYFTLVTKFGFEQRDDVRDQFDLIQSCNEYSSVNDITKAERALVRLFTLSHATSAMISDDESAAYLKFQHRKRRAKEARRRAAF